MFVHYRTKDLMKSAESARIHLTALKYHLRTACCDTSAFENAQLAACKRAILLDPTLYRPRSRQVLPFPLECVESIIHHFRGTNRHKDIIAVAAAFAFCCLLRPSEYCRTSSLPSATKHVIRADQVLFERASTGPKGQSSFHSADSIPPGFTAAQLISCKITFKTAKNIALRGSRSVWFSADTPSSINLPRMMFEWAIRANLVSNDFFVSYRPQPGLASRPLHYGRFKGILRHTGRLFGLTGRVAGHGLRIGGASHLRASGADDGTIMLMGRWKSLPACLGYQAASTATHDRLLQTLGTPGGLTARDIRLGQATAVTAQGAAKQQSPRSSAKKGSRSTRSVAGPSGP